MLLERLLITKPLGNQVCLYPVTGQLAALFLKNGDTSTMVMTSRYFCCSAQTMESSESELRTPYLFASTHTCPGHAYPELGKVCI